MSKAEEVFIPDIGDVDQVEVIEVAISPGDNVEQEQSLITLESDKATMDVPAPFAGKVTKLCIALGDKAKQGDLIALIEPAEADANVADKADTEPASVESAATAASSKPDKNAEPLEQELDLLVPDMGDVDEAELIEVLIAKGDQIEIDQPVVVLETEKASLEVPAEVAGKVLEVSVSVGDKVKKGQVLAKVKTAKTSSTAKMQGTDKAPAKPQNSGTKTVKPSSYEPETTRKAPVPDYPIQRSSGENKLTHASPAVRRFARELGADLTKINGTGPKNRILKDDVQSWVKYELSRPKVTATTTSSAMPEMPKVDHSKYGEVEEVALTRIQKVSSVALHRNWVVVPHVTQHDEVDVTELEEFRKSMKAEAEKEGVRITSLAFMIKAVVKALKTFPKFNASLSADGETIIMKKYFHIGVAVETPDGLVVPVLRDADRKSVMEVAKELGELSAAARAKKLTADDMKGSCFTISSLGGIGGSAFTPIVNWPDVAILGVSRHQMKPVWNGKDFEPRLMLPLSLSYDHRVIDGADAARFIVYLGKILEDIRRILL